MRLLFLILAFVFCAPLICAPGLRAAALDDQLFEKQMEILQHAWLSGHVDDKCGFLRPEDRAILEWGVAHLGAIIVKAPQNKLGDKVSAFIGEKMQKKASEIPCDAPARRGVAAALQTVSRLKAMHGDPRFARQSEDLRSFQMALALNRKCAFYDRAADDLMQDRIAARKAAVVAKLGNQDAAAALEEEGRLIEAAVSANENACDETLSGLVRQALRVAAGPAAVPACKQNARCAVVAAREDECLTPIRLETWLDLAQRGEGEREAHLSTMKNCVADRPDVQARISALSEAILGTLGEAPEDLRLPLLRFVRAALQLAADGGFAQAQRELARLHGPPPGSLLAELGGIDQPLSLRWTRKAAARKEPYAMVDLAQHMREENPATAYILLRAAQDSGIEDKPSLSAVRAKLDAQAIRALEASRAGFDFTSLERE